MCYFRGSYISNSLHKNKPSKLNDKISRYFEDPYQRDFKWYFYPTAKYLLEIARRIRKCVILEVCTFQTSLSQNKPN